MPEFRPRYNIAPTMDILTVRETASSRIGSMMRWGLIPFWAKDLKKIPVMNNARAETVAGKPMFRHAFRERRCLIPASGFFEWQARGKHKQPYFISARDGTPLSFAGIWGTWLDPDCKADDALLVLLKPYDAERMHAWPVSAAVGKAANQGEQLFQPLI
jgi:putative SOS response-associated peptidase YedK